MGWISAALGLLFHFTIAFTAATIYYVASRKIRVLVEHAVVCGLLYGEGVFLFMYFAVLPLSAVGGARPLIPRDAVLPLIMASTKPAKLPRIRHYKSRRPFISCSMLQDSLRF